MSFRFIDYNEMLVKPADVDVVAIFDIDAGPGGELKKIKFGTWKSFFVMRDEDTDIAANHEYQTNKKLKHGAAGEYEQYHNATDMYFVSTTATGKMIFKLNSVTALTFYPATTSIGIGAWNLSNDGGANDGINFNANGNLQLLSNCNIDTASNWISGSGAAGVGLGFAGGVNATFTGSVTHSGTTVHTGQTTHNGILRQNDHIDLASKYISGTGAAATGLTFGGGANATFTGTVSATSYAGAVAATGITASAAITATGKIRSNLNFNCSGNDGVTQGFGAFPTSMNFVGGLLVGFVV